MDAGKITVVAAHSASVAEAQLQHSHSTSAGINNNITPAAALVEGGEGDKDGEIASRCERLAHEITLLPNAFQFSTW